MLSGVERGGSLRQRPKNRLLIRYGRATTSEPVAAGSLRKRSFRQSRGTCFIATCRALAWRLNGRRPVSKRLSAITRGGLVPAAIVARELGISADRDRLHSKLRPHDPRRSDAPERASRRRLSRLVAARGMGVLIVDDLVDTGQTAKDRARYCCRVAHFATVYAKPMGRPLVDTFITEVSQDTWIYFPWDTGPGVPAADPRRRGVTRFSPRPACGREAAQRSRGAARGTLSELRSRRTPLTRRCAPTSPQAGQRLVTRRSATREGQSMPLQNRVTPSGDIIATPASRDVHRQSRHHPRPRHQNPAERSAGPSPAWLTCVCEFRGRRREVHGRAQLDRTVLSRRGDRVRGRASPVLLLPPRRRATGFAPRGKKATASAHVARALKSTPCFTASGWLAAKSGCMRCRMPLAAIARRCDVAGRSQRAI